MPARCRPRPGDEAPLQTWKQAVSPSCLMQCLLGLCQQTNAWSRSFPSSYSCSLPFQHASMLGFYRWNFWTTIHNLSCLSYVFSSPPDNRWLVSTIRDLETFKAKKFIEYNRKQRNILQMEWLSQKVKGEVFLKAEQTRAPHRKSQPRPTLLICRLWQLDEKPNDASKFPRGANGKLRPSQIHWSATV